MTFSQTYYISMASPIALSCVPPNLVGSLPLSQL